MSGRACRGGRRGVGRRRGQRVEEDLHRERGVADGAGAAARSASPLLELCSLTVLTPLISRSRSSVWATSGWLVAQPWIVKAGRLPGGVAELPLEAPAAAALAFAAARVPLPAADPTVPSSVFSDASEGSTRATSWKAFAQSKRESTSWEIVCSRCSRRLANVE